MATAKELDLYNAKKIKQELIELMELKERDLKEFMK